MTASSTLAWAVPPKHMTAWRGHHVYWIDCSLRQLPHHAERHHHVNSRFTRGTEAFIILAHPEDLIDSREGSFDDPTPPPLTGGLEP